MIRYRLAVGEVHEAAAKHIVGAIANEAGLDSEYMGRIEIYERHSTIELPDGMPKEIFEHLRKVRVRGERLRIAPDSEFETGRPRLDISPDKPKKPKKKKNKNRERQRKDKGKRTKT